MSLEIGFTLAAIVCLLIMSAFFSGSETALTATSRARLTEIERRGSRRAAMALSLTEMRERLIGALLLGNNVVNISASALATVVLVRIFGDSGAVIATAVMTVLVLIFGEVMPKTYAIAYPDRVAIAVAPVVRVLVAVFGPLVMTVEYIVKNVLRIFGANIGDAQNVLSAHDELRGAIDLHLKEGSVIKKDRDMLGGILDLQELVVSDLMVHRTRMTLVDAAENPADIVATVLKSGHTRIPAWKDKPENIIGILHAKNLFAGLQKHGGDASKLDIEDILLPAWFVPDTRAIPDQLNAFLRRKMHFAIVVDEYGELQGMITLEDIIEEIVGDITDEHDVVAAGVRQKPDGSFTVDGGVPVRDLNRAFDWQLPDDEATTLAGLVIHEARMISDVGQTFNFHGFQFEVLKKRKHQVTSVKVTPLKQPGNDSRRVDLVIVGASFAGLICARTAALRGLKTIVIEAKSDPGARIHTTGIMVKEAAEEVDTPPQFSRAIHGVRLYAPSLKSIDLRAPGYYFLTTDTAGLIRWFADEARRAGAEVICGRKFETAQPVDNGFLLPQFDLQTRYLVGADGARSTVARLFALGRNEKFLTGLEIEYESLPQADDGLLHCFLDTRLARGYLAWVAPAPGFFQVGLATNGQAKPDLKAFLAHTDKLFGFSNATVKERRSGLIPVGGPVTPFSARNVLLIGDAAGHVSPLTGGGIRLAFRYGRRAAQLIADHLTRHGPPPETVLSRELPSVAKKLALRRVMDAGPPNWLYNLLIGTPAMNWFARQVYFHRRAEEGDTLEAFEKRIKD